MFGNMKKSPPFPHPYAVCAPDGMSIKGYYKDYYEEVFIFLHPFGPPYSANLDLLETPLNKFDMMEQTRSVRWDMVIGLLGMTDYKELDVALRTLISGLRDKDANEEAAKRVSVLKDKERIYDPGEGFLPVELINPLLEAIKREGHDWIWVGDEFGSELKQEYIDDLWKSDKLEWNRKNLFTHDNELLVTTHWDSHFSMLCSDKETIARIVKRCDLEGFYCDDKTEIYWGLQ